MKFFCMLSLFLFCQPTALASTDASDNAVNYNAGSMLISHNCSASFVKTRSRRYFVSASHCFEKKPNKKINAYVYNSKTYRKIRNTKVRINFKKDYYFNRNGDFLFKEIPSSTKIKTNLLKVSEIEPRQNDKVTVLGYPLVEGKRVATKLNCEFMGTSTYYTYITPVTIGRIIKCRTHLKSVKGMSGGPVLNESGELLGALSAEILPDPKYKYNSSPFIYLIYNEITNDLLENQTIRREIYDFVMLDTERYTYTDADEIEYVTPAMYNLY